MEELFDRSSEHRAAAVGRIGASVTDLTRARETIRALTAAL